MYSTGVMPLSSEAKISGWSASNDVSVLWVCSSPRPKKSFTFALAVGAVLTHLQEARQVNFAASGASFNASRASRSAWTLTPLSDGRHGHVIPFRALIEGCSEPRDSTTPGTPGAQRTGDIIVGMATSTPKPAVGSVGTVETEYLDLPNPLRLDCGRELHPIRIAYETYGTLAPARDNVILVCHALSGDAHAAGLRAAAARREHPRRLRR